MQYTVLSRGRPIGVTQLGFRRIHPRRLSGWFHPNAEGERLMPAVSAVLPAVRAFMHRELTDDEGRPLVRPELLQSTLFGDIAEALHRVGALDLTLQRDDGSDVPTELIGIQDTEQLLRLAEETLDDEPYSADETFDEDVTWYADDLLDLNVEFEARHIVSPLDLLGRWSPEDEATEFPRFQVHVVLADAGPIT